MPSLSAAWRPPKPWPRLVTAAGIKAAGITAADTTAADITVVGTTADITAAGTTADITVVDTEGHGTALVMAADTDNPGMDIMAIERVSTVQDMVVDPGDHTSTTDRWIVIHPLHIQTRAPIGLGQAVRGRLH